MPVGPRNPLIYEDKLLDFLVLVLKKDLREAVDYFLGLLLINKCAVLVVRAENFYFEMVNLYKTLHFPNAVHLEKFIRSNIHV